MAQRVSVKIYIYKNWICDRLQKLKATGETNTSKSNNFVLKASCFVPQRKLMGGYEKFAQDTINRSKIT